MPKQRRQQGTGSVFQRADGYWLGQLDVGYGPNGNRLRKTVSGRNPVTVKRRLAELVRQYDETGTLPKGQQTVKAWADYWLEHIAAPRVRPRTLATYRGHVAQYIVPAIGRTRIDKLGPQHIRTLHSYITAQGLSSTTAQHAHVTLAKCLTDAVREGLIPRNPATRVDAPRRAVSNRTALSAAHGIDLLVSVADDPYGPRWAAALLTGARQGEILGLEVGRVYDDHLDVSWQLQRLTYAHGCDEPCGKRKAGNCPARTLNVPAGFEIRETTAPGLFLTRPKSKAGTRLIPLVEPLRGILLAAVDGRTEGMVWDRSRIQLNTGKRSTQARDEAWPIDPKEDNRAWHAALEATGLPSVPLHAARHTTATLLLEAGVDAHVVTQILGQSSVITARGYQHVSLALATDAMRALGAALSGASESPSA